MLIICWKWIVTKNVNFKVIFPSHSVQRRNSFLCELPSWVTLVVFYYDSEWHYNACGYWTIEKWCNNYGNINSLFLLHCEQRCRSVCSDSCFNKIINIEFLISFFLFPFLLDSMQMNMQSHKMRVPKHEKIIKNLVVANTMPRGQELNILAVANNTLKIDSNWHFYCSEYLHVYQ
jgi:hypothetical protein